MNIIKKSRSFNLKDTYSGYSEIKRRVIFVIAAILIFRIGCFIPIPGINTMFLSKLVEKQHGTLLDMFNMFSGGALSRASIFALGIMPYISASIIIQLLTVIHSGLAEIKKEGESGRRKINHYTRYATFILCLLQSIGIVTALPHLPGMQILILNIGLSFYLTAVFTLVTSTMFLMWLGEQMTEYGIGNGTSLLIYAGIVAGLPNAIINTIEQSRQGDLNLLLLLVVLIFVLAITFFVVFMEKGQRRIMVNYAIRPHARRFNYNLTAQHTHLPLKINMAGVIPAIFASSLILFPITLGAWFGEKIQWNWLNRISLYLQPGEPLYIILYTIAIIFFCFFYTSLVFNPRETADNLKKSGAFVPGIRPGEQTAKYIHQIMNRLTLIGALYVSFICLIPEFMRSILKVPFHFGGTSLLIVVVVIMDFMTQIQTIMMSKQYESLLKKTKINK
ncbi:MAG: preprotein translocase subunit SecY [Candidatus Dasytiphilus stammeri]